MELKRPSLGPTHKRSRVDDDEDHDHVCPPLVSVWAVATRWCYLLLASTMHGWLVYVGHGVGCRLKLDHAKLVISNCLACKFFERSGIIHNVLYEN